MNDYEFSLKPGVEGYEHYAVRIDSETKRVQYITYEAFGMPDDPLMNELPPAEGRPFDYLLINGQYVYDPLSPDPVVPDELTLLKAQNAALADRLEFMEDCIAEMAGAVYA